MKYRDSSIDAKSTKINKRKLRFDTNNFFIALKTVTLVFFMVLFAFVPLVFAAPVTIDSDVQDDHETWESTGAAVVFISDQVGYVFYLDPNSPVTVAGIPKYRKTTNGGTSWGSPVPIGSQQDIEDIGGVWYDRWTPGDSTGTTIYISYTETDGKVYFNALDTSDDTFDGEVAVSPDLGDYNQDDGDSYITKATDGDLYIYVAGTSVQDVYKSENGGTTWASTSADTGDGGFLDDDDDQGCLMPLSGGDVLLTWYDATATNFYSRVLSAAGSWDGSSATVATGIPYNEHKHSSSWGASVYKSTGDIYLALNDNPHRATSTNIETYFYDEDARSWSAKTNVISGSTSIVWDVKVAIDENAGAVYVVYHEGQSSGHVYYKKSTDDMTTWVDHSRVPG